MAFKQLKWKRKREQELGGVSDVNLEPKNDCQVKNCHLQSEK